MSDRNNIKQLLKKYDISYSFREDDFFYEDILNLKKLFEELKKITDSSDEYEAKERLIEAKKLIYYSNNVITDKLLKLEEKYFGRLEVKKSDLQKTCKPTHIELCKIQLGIKLLDKLKKQKLDCPETEIPDSLMKDITKSSDESNLIMANMNKIYEDDFIFQTPLISINLFISSGEKIVQTENKKKFYEKVAEVVKDKVIQAKSSVVEVSKIILDEKVFNPKRLKELLDDKNESLLNRIGRLISESFKTQEEKCRENFSKVQSISKNLYECFNSEINRIELIINSKTDFFSAKESMLVCKNSYNEIIKQIEDYHE